MQSNLLENFPRNPIYVFTCVSNYKEPYNHLLEHALRCQRLGKKKPSRIASCWLWLYCQVANTNFWAMAPVVLGTFSVDIPLWPDTSQCTIPRDSEHSDFLYTRVANNLLCGGHIKNALVSLTSFLSKATYWGHCVIGVGRPWCAYAPSPWPCVRIPVTDIVPVHLDCCRNHNQYVLGSVSNSLYLCTFRAS